MNIDLFVLDAQLRLPGCPRGAVMRQLRAGWREFCRRTKTLRETIAVNIQEDVTDYPLVPRTQDADVLSISNAWVRSVEEVTSNRTGRLLDPRFYRLVLMPTGQNAVRLSHAPGDDVNCGLTLECVLLPHRDRAISDELLTSRYFEGLVGFAVAKLAAQERRPWSNPMVAAMGQSEFSAALSAALNLDARDGKDTLACLET